MMKKRTLAALLSLALCCTSAAALAKTETKYGLTIESENGDWRFAEESVTAPVSEDETLTFPPEGVLTITKPGTYTLSGSGKRVVINDVKGAVTLTLDGVTLEPSYNAAMMINNSAKTTLVLKGKNSMTGGTSSYAALNNGTNPLEITCIGCGTAGHTCGELTVTSNSYSSAAIGSGNSNPCSNLTISGGKISADGGSSAASIGSGVDGKCSNLTISGGTVTATNTGAAIGSGQRGDVDGITISGGTVVATSTGYYGAAIGSGGTDMIGSETNYGFAKNILISGGNVTASAPYSKGAGIGAGAYSRASDITVSGGDVHIQANGGAGIGCGGTLSSEYQITASDITVSGGKIDIQFNHGAGIGSGDLASASNIVISGGDITLTPSAGGGGAGIGSGWHGNADGITISGGEIDVQSRSGAGIGSGSSGDAKNITISGGSIKAAGGIAEANGIGAGTNGTASSIVIAPANHRITASISTTGFADMDELEGSPFTGGSTDVTAQVSGFQYFKTVGERIGAIDMPETGDSASLALWTALLALSGALLMMRKRRVAG